MAKRKYTINSPEGLTWARTEGHDVAEVGDEITTELPDETELALIAAGWLSHEEKSKGGSK